jgi:hypothetical protein
VRLGRVLKGLGFSHIRAGPQHPAQNAQAIATSKNLPAVVAEAPNRLAPDTAIEEWFQDDVRVGQKNSLAYQWTKKGTRPRQPKDRRYENVWRGLSELRHRRRAHHAPTPKAIEEIGRAPGAHALFILDKAGWRTTGKLRTTRLSGT